ncbi:MAG TPA: hypothetical protein VFI73_02700 [Candidatus Nitrosopolaris sp.]|nr:hypothetical protein [Candidatus Nitrosopolaris sp.]
MHTTKLTILAIVSATVLVLVTGSIVDDTVLAAKTDTNLKNKNTTSPSKDLKNLFACESTAAKSPGGLTQDGLVNCYTQTFSGNSAVPAGAVTPDIGSNSANTTHHISSTSHPHHHSSGKSSRSPSAAALSGLG